MGALVATSVHTIEPPDRSHLFWVRVAWLCVLATLAWGATGSYLLRGIASSRPDGSRAIPTLLPLAGALSYACLSALLLATDTFVIDEARLHRYHFAAQLLLGGVFVASSALIALPGALSQAGHHESSAWLAGSSLVAKLIAAESLCGNAMTPTLAASVRTLRERLQYTLPSRVDSSLLDSLIELEPTIHNFVDSLVTHCNGSPSEPTRSSLTKEAQILVSRLDAILASRRPS